jgi:hypothetical protein
MEKKIVSLRLEENLLEHFKKRARQEGMTFTDFVSKSMHYFDDLLMREKNIVEDLDKDKLALYAETEDISVCLTDYSTDDIQATSEEVTEILNIKKNLQSLAKEILNEKSRHRRNTEDIDNKFDKLAQRLDKIQNQKVISEQPVVCNNGNGA